MSFSTDYLSWRSRLESRQTEVVTLATRVLKDFQAAQLLLQSKAYLRLQQLIEYINEGD